MKNVRREATPELVLELKAEAKLLKQRDGLKQTAALATLAIREGYRSWEELIGLAGGRQAVDDAKNECQPTPEKMAKNQRQADRRLRYGNGA